MEKIGYMIPEICEAHEMGQHHPERPQRLKVLKTLFSKLDSSGKAIKFQPNPAKHCDILRVHSQELLDKILINNPIDGYFSLDADTIINSHSLEAALLAAGSVIMAVENSIEGTQKKTFCAVRPPGHHAERNRSMGFCIFNSVAVGAAYALEKLGVKRVAILDFDVHHGNGTENIF